jgi:ribose transport system substrate-binding protein
MRSIPKRAGAVTLTLGLVLLTACGYGGSGAATANATTCAASSVSSATNDTDLTTRVDKLLAAPTGIGRVTPLSKKPATGKFIVGLTTPIATAQVTGSGQAEATKLLGWKYQTIQEGTGPEDPAKALDAAIALKPDGIIYYSTQRQEMQAGLDEAKSLGITVVTSATPDPAPWASPIIAGNNNSTPQLCPLGAGIADYVAQRGARKAKVALVTLPVYAVLGAFDTAFKSQLHADCPNCSVTELPQQLTDIGTATPPAIVDALHRDPSINYVIFDCGCAASGVSSALAQAGIKNVVLGGEGPLTQSIQEVRNGSDEAWAALPLESMGYGLIDTFARHFNGDSLDPVFNENPSWQILTKDNVAKAEIDRKGNYIGYQDFNNAWAALWKVQK